MSNKVYRLVIFDWEGTLADTLGPVLQVIADEVKAFQIGVFDHWKAREYAAFGLTHALKKLFPHLSLNQYEQLLQNIQEKIAKSSFDVTLIPGARHLIETLHQQGVYLAIATNKGHHSLMRALQASELSDYFKVTRSAGQVPAKPCPQMLEEIMEAFAVSPEDTVMIGDSLVDIEMANLAGVDAIGVHFEPNDASDLCAAGAMAVFDDYHHLAQYLKLSGIEKD